MSQVARKKATAAENDISLFSLSLSLSLCLLSEPWRCTNPLESAVEQVSSENRQLKKEILQEIEIMSIAYRY